MRWIDEHPRTGWYIASFTTLNAILNTIDVLFFRG